MTLPEKDQLTFYLNDRLISVKKSELDLNCSLIEFVRDQGLTGTKLGCSEGGCGSCTVVVASWDYINRGVVYNSVNACLAPVLSVEGKHVITVEGIGSSSNPHPAQEKIASAHGSQCGFCTPGIVMSLYAAMKNAPEGLSKHEIEDSFDGNLCRCTGYRSILDGAKSLATKCDGCVGGCNGKACGDIESATASLSIKDKGTDPPFPETLLKQYMGNPQPTSYHFDTPQGKWFHPATLEQMLTIVDQYPEAKIINGNTEIGIEVRFKSFKYPIQINATDVLELKNVKETQNGLELGGGITLSNLQKILQKYVNKLPEHQTRGFVAMLDNMKYFAGTQIRNVAVLAGNIATASPISDLNPVLLGLDAIINLKSLKGGDRAVKMSEFFLGYRKTALKPGEIIYSVSVPFTKPTEYVKAYKQSKRKDDDIAIVNAGLRVLLDQNVIKEVSLAFGGMAPTTVLARGTMEKLIGRTWSDNVFDDLQDQLLQDMPMGATVPGGQPTYRRSLALSFMTKFRIYVAHCLSKSVKPFEESALKDIERQISKGSQEYHVKGAGEATDVIGKVLPHAAAFKQVAGEAVYVDDIPPVKGELFAAIVASTEPHAYIKSVDTSAALAMPGVRAYISASDIPGYRKDMSTKDSHNPNVIGPVFRDEELFATKEVFCVGQMIGMVVAESHAIARSAAKLVKVTYQKLSHIISMEEAIAAKSFHDITRNIRTGAYAPERDTITVPLSEAIHHVEGETRMSAQEHFYLETQCSIVIPKKEDGELEVIASTQNPTETQHLVAHVMGVSDNKVVCKVKRMGGGFGGKETRSVFVSCGLAVAARKLGVPVRCMLTREEDMVMSGTRHPFLGRYKVGFTDEGKLVSLELDIYSNAGYSYDLSLAVLERSMTHSDNTYHIPNVNITGRLCKTNIMTNTAFRGFGGPQGMMVCEQWLNHVADYLNKPIDEIRQINFYHTGQKTHFDQTLENYYFERVWFELLATSDYYRRKDAVDQFNQVNRYKKRGIIALPTKFGISFTARWLNQAGALVHIYTDGSVLLTHGGTEMGQGLHTKMIQIAAHALSCPVESVHISETSTNTVPNTSATAASVSSDLNGAAVLDACRQLNERLEPYRKKYPNASFASIVSRAYFDRVNLSANGFYKTPDLTYDWATNRGRMFNYFTYGAAVAEVEIDVLTGDHVVKRADVVMDIGKSLNPAIDVGQIEGAFVQGQGWSTIEEPWISPTTGFLWTRGPGGYKIPGFKDIPEDFRIRFVKGSENPRAVHSSKAVGEPPLFLGASVFYAIRKAIQAARADNGLTGYFRLDSPATSERIRVACGDKLVEKAKVELKPGEKPWAYPA